MKGLLSDNFRFIGYSKEMLQNLDRIIDHNQIMVNKDENFNTLKLENEDNILFEFEKSLSNQESNITEIGEKELTDSVRLNFGKLKKEISEKNLVGINSCISVLKKLLYKITDLNSKTLFVKNSGAESRAKNGIYSVSFLAAFCLITSFTLLINFPPFIADPIKELNAGFRQIADRNYDQRLHFKSNDEFGELALAFNTMAKRLYEYQNTTLAKVYLEKKRFEIILDKIKYPVLGVDGNNKIFFINQTAAIILGLSKQELMDKSAPEISLRNDLMRIILAENFNDKQINIFFENKESHFRIQTINIEIEHNFVGKAYLLMFN